MAPAAVPTTEIDHALMGGALALARRGLGRAWPNPSVGCVLVKDGAVIARGVTQKGGRPHAEAEALAQAGAAARGATAYVTLEPCAHVSERGPACTDALIEARIRRAVIAMVDPDPRTAGGGISRLETARIQVTVGCREAEAREITAGFLHRLATGRPLVTLKLATSLDGRIALANGESKWITGPAARARGHLMRAGHDAILVGAATARRDDPELTCRLPGLDGRSPVRAVLASRVEPLLKLRMLQTARQVPLWILTAEQPLAHVREWAEKAGAKILPVAADSRGRPDLKSALTVLGAQGITLLLVEGGGEVAAGLLKADLVDRLAWFRAAQVIGGDGTPGVAALGLQELTASHRFQRISAESVGPDGVEFFGRIAH